MKCTDCTLQSPQGLALSTPELLTKLEACGECPLLLGTEPCPSPVLTNLVGKLREQAGQARRQANKLRRAEHALTELQQEISRSDERVTRLEQLHAQSVRESDAALRKQMQAVAQKQEAIMALATPVIQVWDGVLVLPLIGVLDDERVAQLTSHLLGQVQERRAHHVILDLTGISTLDEQSARRLLKVVQALALLGAKVLLCGLRAEVAMTLSTASIDLRSLLVARSLQEALLALVSSEPASPRTCEPARKTRSNEKPQHS